MRTSFKNALRAALVTASLAMVAAPAHAISVTYIVGGTGPMLFPGPVTPPANAPWGPNGYPGDTVEFVGYTGALNLAVGSSVQKVNTLRWLIDYTYAGTATDPNAWSDLAFNVNAPRAMTIDGGPSANISQTGLLDVTWENDFLALSLGGTSTFFVQGYQVDVTPLALAQAGGTFSGDNPWLQPDRDVMARFDVSAVPEPTTMAMGTLLLGMFGAGKFRSIRRKRKA